MTEPARQSTPPPGFVPAPPPASAQPPRPEVVPPADAQAPPGYVPPAPAGAPPGYVPPATAGAPPGYMPPTAPAAASPSRAPLGARPPFGRRAAGGLVDLAAIALLTFGLKSFSPTAIPILAALVAWLVCRPLPLVAYGATLGHALLRYRVVGPDGGRPTWGAALERDPVLLASAPMAVWRAIATAFPGAAAPDTPADDRYQHDAATDTWPVLVDDVHGSQ
jgi:hypothetical protein